MDAPETEPAPHDQAGLDWTPQGPRSRRFDDVYFSAVDGLAEARAVFLDGCGLPQRWRGRPRFVVGELGFGSGLNILALLDLWGRSRDPGAQLSLFSVEAFPITREEAARALAAWPQLAALAATLTAAWPSRRPGFHRIDLPALSAQLDLWIGDAAEGLQAWTGAADAWFLDGFAPSKNPQMWRPEVLAGVAARCAPGARLASFTVAGAVRRGLAQVGLQVEKKPGFGRKRERLEATAPAQNHAQDSGQVRVRSGPGVPSCVVIVGAGIAGAALARALRRLGCDAAVVDVEAAGAGASGNPAALVTPRLDAGFGVAATLHAQAFARAVDLYRRETPEALVAEGALQLETATRDVARFDRIAAWDGLGPGAVRRLSPQAVAGRLGEAPSRGGLWLSGAVVVEPVPILRSWLGPAPIIRRRIQSLERVGSLWRLMDDRGGCVVEADMVVLACGPDAGRLLRRLGPAPPILAVRGQVSWTADVAFSGDACAFGGYALPLPSQGFLFGATHDRDDEGLDPRPDDDEDNLDRLAAGRPALAARLRQRGAPVGLQARASLRAATPDHLPLAGAVADAEGLYVLTGLGGRGFTLAPLLAEHVASQVVGAPSPLPRASIQAVDPRRYGRSDGATLRPRTEARSQPLR